MSVTPNFSWPLIEPTDFVTNLPADLELLADDIDADVWAIKGTADAALPETIIDAAGDLIYGSAADTAARLAIGTAGQVLTVNAGATAPEWADAAGGGTLTLAQIATGSTTSGTQLQLSSLTTYDKLILQYYNIGWGTADTTLNIRINNNANNDYLGSHLWWNFDGTSVNGASFSTDTGANRIVVTRSNNVGNGSKFNSLLLVLENCKETGFTHWEYLFGGNTGSSTVKAMNMGKGIFKEAAAVSSIEIYNNNAYTLDQGTYTLWGG